MTNPLLAASALALALTAPLAQAGDISPEGNWSRGDGKARVRIEPCGNDLCAINTWIKPGVKDEKVGDKLVMTVKPAAQGKWSGKAYDPQRNMTYRLSMDVGAERMTTRGCVLGGLVCKGVNWTRIG